MRRLILTDELMALPAQFARFIERVEGFIANQEQFNGEQRQFNRRLETAVGELRGNAARQVTGALAGEVAESLGLELRNTVSRNELRAIIGAPGLSGVDRGDRLSFIRADLVIGATDPAAETHYIAVEASYTGDQRDTARARRNAELLHNLTGHPSHAVVASVRNVREIQPEIDNSQVHWFELDPDDFTPD